MKSTDVIYVISRNEKDLRHTYVGQTSRFLTLDLPSTIIVSKSLAKLILFFIDISKNTNHYPSFHEVNISRLPVFVNFSLLNIRLRNKRSHGILTNVNLKRKNRHVLSFSDLSMTLNQSGLHMALSR